MVTIKVKPPYHLEVVTPGKPANSVFGCEYDEFASAVNVAYDYLDQEDADMAKGLEIQVCDRTGRNFKTIGHVKNYGRL